jgi:hypothetical protein
VRREALTDFLHSSDEFLASSGIKPSLYGKQMSSRPRAGDVILKGMVVVRVTIFARCFLSLSAWSVVNLPYVYSPGIICDVACRICRNSSVMVVTKARNLF